ncbi:hypothetical protein M1466_02905 [Candidatus Dependentiae bacterium]|nr:hypothetical protein [Candidatus Dependentiae bacterium]
MKHWSRIIIVALLLINRITCLPAPIWYQASELNQEPWFEQPLLTSLTVKGRAAIVTRGFNAIGEKTTVFGIYGPDSIHYMAAGVPGIANQPTNYLATLPTLQAVNNQFGATLFNAELTIANWSIELTQNLCHGFYLQLVAPFRRITVKNISFCTNAHQTEVDPTIDWHALSDLRNNLIPAIAAYGTYLCNNSVQHISDLQCLLGWTRNDDSSYYLDFLDYSFITGIYAPTSTQVNPAYPLQFSTGYNKHLSIPLMANVACGLCDWITLHAYLGAIVITKKREPVGLMTAWRQQGIIRLAHSCAAVKPGTIVQFGGSCKADHVIHGLSLLCGLGYDHQDPTRVYPCDASFDTALVNADPRFQSWSMVTLHLAGSYDYATVNNTRLPLITLSADLPIHGTRILKTDMLGAALQLTISYCF